jgi:hypothetical protein
LLYRYQYFSEQMYFFKAIKNKMKESRTYVCHIKLRN